MHTRQILKKPIVQIILEISPSIKVTRKTASKYIKDYEMSKNAPFKSTIIIYLI